MDTDHSGLPLRVGDLSLRRIDTHDRNDLWEIYRRPEVSRYEFFEVQDVGYVDQVIASQTGLQPGDPGVPLYLVAELTPQNKVIGKCQLMIHSVDDQQGEIGFAFHPDFWGNGYASQAVNAALGFGFHRLQLHRIMAATDVRNVRSWKLMERIGMRREAHFVHDNLVGGEWIDDYVYAMLDSEWSARNGM